ncbi:hypothetical protein FJZ40_04485 [Candidatus Shapirobacteria bacterium]|nr:hypothetical protein [Candidatus Shapirobacteria bacterium]
MRLPVKKLLTAFGLFVACYFLLDFLPLVRAEWVMDAEVTEVGRNSERARQLIYWLFTHPSLDNSPAIAAIWSVARNIVFVFFVILLIFMGFEAIVFKRRPSLANILPKLIGLLAWTALSYVLVLGLIQIGDLLMRFFIERVAGANLFNITFAGGNIEQNYTDFVGFRENTMVNQESANTGLFMVRLTTLTYNVMFASLVLRKVILWFLLTVAPFLSLLMPFVFIRNIGWIWIGVFFQWLFYGPLLSLFLAGLVKIWEFGIPFNFDWTRRDTPQGQIYKTAINILYGGPAQTLSPTNSANYVDTYAEYVIALIMLWTVILFPWLLLRIFRDYCCEAFKSQESAVMALYNKISGGVPPPPPPPPPSVTPAAKFERPFKAPLATTMPETISAAQVAQISQAETKEIMRAMNLQVASLRDVSTFDMNLERRRAARENLSRLSSPTQLSSTSERRKFTALRQELISRAMTGDLQAQRALAAAEQKPQVMIGAMTRPRVVVAAPPAGKKPSMVPITKPVPPTPVTVEEYEEVKKMWINHYRSGDVPITDRVKSREDWIKGDLAQITNTLDLISSKQPEEKQKGYDLVASILPFLLLGGFSEDQTVTYLKAKLEAAKVVQEELERTEKIKEEAKKEGEEELVEVAPAKEAEEKKEGELAEELAIESKTEKPEKPSGNENSTNNNQT